jgi:hypothetical protein
MSQLNDAEYSVRYSLQILLYESRTEMNVELHERRFANVLEAVHLACLDHEDVAGAPFELVLRVREA